MYKEELAKRNEGVVILANQRSSVVWLEDFPALTDACARPPAIGKEKVRSLTHPGVFKIITLIYVYNTIKRETT